MTNSMNEDKRYTADDVISSQRNRQKGLIVVLVVLLAAGIGFDKFIKPDEKTKAHEIWLIDPDADFKKADIAEVEIKPAAGKAFTIKQVAVGKEKKWLVSSRFDCQANSAAVGALLTKLTDARRLSIPTTTDESKFVIYSLDDKSAVTVVLRDSSGKEIFSLKVGKAPEGNRDFVRLTKEGATEGIFELVYKTKSTGSLYSRLNMKGQSQVNPGRWLNMSAFRVMPLAGVADGLVLRNATETSSFLRKPAADNQPELWQMISPNKATALGETIKSVITSLTNLSASDVAGLSAQDASKLGTATPKRSISLEYSVPADDKPGSIDETHNVEVSIGIEKDGQVAINIFDGSIGTYIFWTAAEPIERLFRPSYDFLKRENLQVKTSSEIAQSIEIKTADFQATIERKPDTNNDWVITSPDSHGADTSSIIRLISFMESVRGYAAGDLSDLINDERWISFTYIISGQDTTRMAVLAFGSPVDDLIPVRLDKDDESKYFRVHQSDITVFMPEYNDLRAVSLRRIVIGFDGSAQDMKDKERSKEDAKKLTDEVLAKAKAEGADFEKLQTEYNEDNLKTKIWTVKMTSPLAQTLKELGMSLKVGEVGLVETPAGFQIIKRVE